MKNYIAIPLMIIYVVVIVYIYTIYAITNDVDIADLVVIAFGGFVLGAIFGWVMTSLKNESEAK